MDVVYNFKLYDVKIEQNKILITFVLEFSREKEESKKLELIEEKPKEVKEETPQKREESFKKFSETTKKISLHRFRFLTFSLMNLLNKKKEQFNNKIPREEIFNDLKKMGYSEEEISKALDTIAYSGLIYFPDKETISIVE